MTVKIWFHPFLEYGEALDKEAESCPENVRIYENDNGTITVIHPIESEDEEGRRRYDLPEAIQFRPSFTNWKLRVDIVGDGEVMVLRNGRPLQPKRELANCNGERIRRYYGGSGELIIKFIREGNTLSMQPVVKYIRRRNDYFIDARTRSEGSPEIQIEFLKRAMAKPIVAPLPPEEETIGPDETEATTHQSDDTENPYPELGDEDDLSPEEAKETLAKYREKVPLSRGPHSRNR